MLPGSPRQQFVNFCAELAKAIGVARREKLEVVITKGSNPHPNAHETA